MQNRGNSCRIRSSEDTAASNSSCVLIVKDNLLLGIFTERDLVKLIATETDLKGMAIENAMSREVIALTYTGAEDIFAALNLLRSHSIRHLPIVDVDNNLLGITTVKNLRRKLQPVNMMKWRKVAEVMKTGVIYTDPKDSIRHVARLMAEHKVSCVAICESIPEADSVHPLGIITERDIVQFQNLDLDLGQPARDVMSAPLFLVSPDDTLWEVHQQMQQHRVRRLLVGGTQGELMGIITQTSLLQVFDPGEMYGVIESLQQQVCQLELSQKQLLENRQSELETEIAEHTAALRTANQQGKAIAEFGQYALKIANLPLILQRAVYLVSDTLEVEYCKVLKLLPDDTLLLDAGVGWHEGLVGTAKIGIELSSQAGYTLQQSQPVVVEDLRTETRFNGSSLLIDHQVVSGISVVIADGGKSYGVLGTHTTKQRNFTQDDVNFLQAIANIIAQANERLQIENKLRESQERYDLAVRGSSNGLWDWNTLTDEVFYAPRFKEMIGYTDAEMPNLFEAWESKLHPEDRKRVLTAVQNHLKDRVPYNVEYRLQTKQGEYCWFNARGQAIWNKAGKAVRMAGSITDISDRKEAEVALRQSEQRFRNMADNAPMMVWVTDENACCTFVSQSWCKFTGQTKETALGLGWLKAVHPDDLDRAEAIFLRANESQEAFEIDYRVRRHDGKYRWAIDAAQPWIGSDGQFKGYIGSVIDISDRKRREKILKDIASGMTVEVGANFLPSLVEYLCKTLEVNFASIGELADSETRIIRTLAVYDRGEIIDNFEYRLAGAPCENVFRQGFCIYPEGVSQLFPQDIYLQQVAAESYAGIPLFNSNGTAFGSIAILDSKPFPDVLLIEEVLKIFAARATAEIERRQAELDLKQSEQKFRAIFDKSFQFIGLLEPNGNLIEANKTALDFIGLSAADVRGKAFWLTPWWSMSSKIQEQIKQAIVKAAKGEFIRFEVEHPGTQDRVMTVDFSLTPIKDETGKVVLLIPEGRNISDRKQAEAKIQEQAALLDIATDAIMVRGLDNTILFWNRGAEVLYGWKTAEILNRDCDRAFNRTSANQLTAIQQAVTETGEWQGELNQVTKSGKEIIVKSRWTLVKNEADEPSSYLIVNTDITEQKQLEAQFLRTQRLESLGTLAGGIAHDLNNILAPILGFSKLLPLKLPDVDEQTKGFFKIMEANANRGTALVKQILTFSRGLEGDKGIVQIRHLINEIGQIVTETFPKAIELSVDAPKTLWTVNADVNQLHQVLMNLCVNARDAMPDGGKLSIQAENFTIDSEYARLHLDAELGAYVKITVTDTGVGIPPEIIDRIFEPFFTTKEIGRGTGLGLSTVIGIVRSHGGFIEVTSDKRRAKGTQFQVFLPASDTLDSQIVANEAISLGNGELILVVDDESSILEITKATLETYNYQVITAKNGIEAVATYANNKEAVSLIIMDIMMPGMDGKTAIRTLKQIDPDVKVIAVSGLITSQEIIKELDEDVTAFLSKPYSNEDLLKTVYEIVSG